MIGTALSHFKILEKLGEGGMGKVYKAEDTKLKREVAIKFLPHRGTFHTDHINRFKIEAQAAAALNHPNIATIYSIDETEDEIFIVMEFIDGQELKQQLVRNEIDPKEVIRISIQIAEGLQAAHNKGVIHRDIKCSNIMISNNDQVKIMDFGLAKIRGGNDVTKFGTTLGTAAYMSPEQASGETVDRRTDIWSLGVVIYEMLTGKLPFSRDYEQAILYAIINEEPKPISSLMTDVPLKLERIVLKSMIKNPDERYQRIEGMLDDLKLLEKEIELGISAEILPITKTMPSIAVLPFKDMSPQKDQEYFCEGIAEEIINALTKLEGLRVVSRTFSFQFTGNKTNPMEVGNQLKVKAVLEGSVRKAGQKLRIIAQLINVEDGFNIWSERYESNLDNIFAIQDEITHSIVESLKLELHPEEKDQLNFVRTKDYQAYDYYLRGRNFFYIGQRKSIKFALEMFSKAISKDNNYALAYAGIADCSSWFFMYVDGDNKYLEKSISASQKAIELDPESAEAHSARGLAISLSKRFSDAEKEFEISIRLNPNLFVAYYFFARIYFIQGKLKEAAHLFEQACIVNPEDYQSPLLLGNTYKGLNLIDKSHDAFKSGLEIAKRHLELNPDDARAIYLSAHGYIELGEKEEGLKWANRALATDPDDPVILYNISGAYALLGREEEAISYLEKSLLNGYTSREWIENDSYLNSIRSNRKFKELLKKMK